MPPPLRAVGIGARFVQPPTAGSWTQVSAIAVKAKLRKADFDQLVALHPTMAEELVLMR